MNEVLQKIKTRRSVRAFRSESVPEDILEQIIEAGTYAASGRNRQPSIIVSVTDKKILQELSKVNAQIMGAPDADPFYGAPAVLIVLAQKGVNTYLYDGSLVMGNLMLAAHSLGVSSCWIHRARETFELPEWKEWLSSLGIQGEYEGIGHVALGYAAGEYPDVLPRKEGRVFKA